MSTFGKPLSRGESSSASHSSVNDPPRERLPEIEARLIEGIDLSQTDGADKSAACPDVGRVPGCILADGALEFFVNAGMTVALASLGPSFTSSGPSAGAGACRIDRRVPNRRQPDGSRKEPEPGGGPLPGRHA